MAEHANVAKSTVATTALTVTSDTITAATGDGALFPQNTPYAIRMGSRSGSDSAHEDMRVLSISGDTLTVHRGRNPQVWVVGTPFGLILPADEGDLWGLGTALNLLNGVTGPLTLKGNAAQALGASAGTIATAALSVSVISIAADASAVVLAAGTVDGQIIFVVNTSATHTATFDTAATSKVADGATSAIPALAGRFFVWNATAGRWYRAA